MGFRPRASLACEHMFSRGTSPLTQRALAAAGLTRSFLLLEDDRRVDWEVDEAGADPVRPHATGAALHHTGSDEARQAGSARSTPAGVAAVPLPHRRVEPVTSGSALGAPSGQGTADDRPVDGRHRSEKKTGGVLLSRALASQVPSALRGLTALFGMGRGVSPSPKPPEKGERPRPSSGPSKLHSSHYGDQKNPSSPRPISTGLLRTLPRFQIRPINLVVYQGSYSLKGMGELILRPASRLDAFSGYPIRT